MYMYVHYVNSFHPLSNRLVQFLNNATCLFDESRKTMPCDRGKNNPVIVRHVHVYMCTCITASPNPPTGQSSYDQICLNAHLHVHVHVQHHEKQIQRLIEPF